MMDDTNMFKQYMYMQIENGSGQSFMLLSEIDQHQAKEKVVCSSTHEMVCLR